MVKLSENTALIIIDVQDGLDAPHLGKRNNPDAETNMAKLLNHWRTTQRPIFHVKHNSVNPHSTLRPELPGNAIKQIVAPQDDEPIFEKSVNNAFVGTNLEERLRSQNIDSVVCIGLTTEHCVSTTARMAGDLGFKTYVVADATACHEHNGWDGTHYPADEVHRVALVSLQDEFATIVKTEDLLL